MQRHVSLCVIFAISACAIKSTAPRPSPASDPLPAAPVLPAAPAPDPPLPRVVVRTHCEDGRPVTTDGVCKLRGNYWKTVCTGESTCSALCDAGDPRGCRGARKARMLATRDGTAGRRYVEKQCALGDRFGCVGLAYIDGKRARRANNAPERQRWQASRVAALTKGCEELQDGKACVSLAYDHAHGGEAKPALHWARRACTLGAEIACVWTARAFIDGHGTRTDVHRGLALLAERCRATSAFACRELERRRRYNCARGRDITMSGATTPR